MNGQRHVLKTAVFDFRMKRYVCQGHDWLIGAGVFFVIAFRKLSPNHKIGKFLFGCIVDIHRCNGTSGTKHGYAVRNAHNLTHFMRDEDNGFTLSRQGVHDIKETLDLNVGEYGGWFVKNEEVGTAVQNLENLNSLLFTNGHLGDLCVKVDLKAIASSQSFNIFLVLLFLHNRRCVHLGSEDDIFQSCHGLYQHEVLMHHANSLLHGITGRVYLDFFSVHEYLSRRRSIKTHKAVHER